MRASFGLPLRRDGRVRAAVTRFHVEAEFRTAIIDVFEFRVRFRRVERRC